MRGWKRKELSSPTRRGVKGKKRGINREIITLGGKKKKEKAVRRKMKRKMNQMKGKAGFPAIKKKDTAVPLMDSPISVLFVDSSKGGLLAKKFKEEERRLGRMTGYNIRIA